ncbi:hypothetical protein CIG35_05600 [Klebsiella pneumoniae]|nr:hypothetical protein CIG35_05600 [Klebsiella pneumoniae]OZQ12582.1 hypothetical protein CIG30_05605 [Klebsiella pneumoniae]
MMSLWDALRMNMMISYQELVRTFLRFLALKSILLIIIRTPFYYFSYYYFTIYRVIKADNLTYF